MYHRVDFRLCGGIAFQQADGFVVQSGHGKVEGIFYVGVRRAAHQAAHVLQHFPVAREQILFVAASHVEAVDLEGFADEGEGFVLASHTAQDGGFQLAGLVVVPVADERAVDQVECLLEVAAAAVDGGQVVVGRVLPGGVPCRLEEGVVSFVRLVLHQEAPAQVVVWFAVVGVRVAFGLRLDGLAEVRLGHGELPLAHEPQPHGVVVADVARFAPQGFPVVFRRVVGGVAVLFQMLPSEEKLFDGGDVLRVLGGLGGVGDGFDFRFVGLVADDDPPVAAAHFRQQVFLFCLSGGERGLERLRRADGDDFVAERLSAGGVFHPHMHVLVRAGGVEDDLALPVFQLHVQQHVFGGVLHVAHFGVGHEVLLPRLLLVGLQPGEVRLVVGVHSRHELDVRAVLVRQVAVPGASEVAVAPGPLLFARRHVVVGHVEQPAPHVLLVSSHEVELRLDGHVRGGYGDVLVFRDVHAGGIVLLVVHARGDGEGGHVALAMVEHGVHVGREHRVVVVVHHHGGIGPPQEGLGERGAVVDFHVDFDVGLARVEREALHPLGAEHAFHLVAPQGLAAVGMFLDGIVRGQEGGRAVVLRPVELDAARDPRPGQSYECGLHHLVVVHEMAPLHLVVGHVDASAQFGQHHDLDVFVLDEERMIKFLFLLVRDSLHHRIGVDRSAAALVDPLLQEDGVLLFLPDLVGGQQDVLFPGTYF